MKERQQKHRRAKMEHQLQRLLGTFLQSSWSGRPQNTLCSVTYVDVSPDLHYATAHLSIYPNQSEAPILEKLNSDIREVQSHLNTSLRTRPVPRISFVPDHGEKRRAAIENILHDTEH